MSIYPSTTQLSHIQKLEIERQKQSEILMTTVQDLNTTVQAMNATIQSQDSSINQMQAAIYSYDTSINQMKAIIQTQNTTINHMNATIQSQDTSINQMKATIQDLHSNHTTQAQQMSSMNDVINSTRHQEHGVVECSEDSDRWPVRDLKYEWITKNITFTSPYDTPPVVYIGGVSVYRNYGYTDTHDMYSNYFSVKVISVTETDFTVECRGWKDWHGNPYYSLEMKANWISWVDLA